MNGLSIGEKVRNFRLRTKISQLELEIEIGASSGSISRIENNLTNPTKETLLKIADILSLNFSEKTELLGLGYNEVEKYIPNRFLNQKINNDTSLNNIINTKFFEFSYVKGKDFFIKECDSSLQIPSNEVFYIQNIHNWRKVYSEQEANTYHVPRRMGMMKYAKFLINYCNQRSKLQK